MTNAIIRTGFEESILYSDDDYEPYGYVSPQLATGLESVGNWNHPYERQIEAAVLRRLDGCTGR